MTTETVIEIHPLTLHLGPLSQKIDVHEFYEFCQRNPELRIEQTSEGDIVIMPPTGGQTGKINFTLNVLLGIWVEKDGTGIGFDSSTCFTLPNGAKRSPDLAWIKRSRWESLTEEEKEEFPPLCPDFVVEIRSKSDALSPLHKKMQEYIANGIQLGWLIDPLEKKIYIYRPSYEVCCLENSENISGDPVLPGFTVDLKRFWG